MVLEKVLLKTIVMIVFQWVVPVICGLFILSIISGNKLIKTIATKLVIFALVIVNIIPMSMKISDYVYNQNKESIAQASQFAELETENVEAEEDTIVDENETENKKWYQKFYDSAKSVVTKVKDTVIDTTVNTIEDAKRVLSYFIDSVAVLILSNCIIPVAFIILVFWLLKYLFGIVVPVESGKELMNKFKSKKIKNKEVPYINIENQ